jgi:hypothetical protein
MFIAASKRKQVTFVSPASSVFLTIRNPKNREGFICALLADGEGGC